MPQRRTESGFTLVELLVVVVIVGLLAAVSVPLVREQQRAALDRTVTADLARYATAADRLFTATFSYPVSTIGFDIRDRGVPAAGPGDTYRAFTIGTGATAGFVVYGQNTTTATVWVVSSFDGGAPARTSLAALPDAPPMPGNFAVPATVTPSSWVSLAGATWGAIPAIDPSTSPVQAITDPTFAAATKAVLSSARVGNIDPYYSAPFRLVDLASPVATRAIEVVTDSSVYPQGVIVYQQQPAPSWPTATPVGAANEQWTASAWVKAPAGQGLRVGCRVTTSTSGYVTETALVITATGSWQRLAATCTSAQSWVGAYVGVQVTTTTTTAGVTFYVTSPQLNKGTVATPFTLG